MTGQQWRNLLVASGLAALTIGSGVPAQAGAGTRQPTAEVDWAQVEEALEARGQLMPGDVFRIGMPRSDLDVAVEGVPVKPGFALGSYAAFRQMGDALDVMVMGDLVLLDEEVPQVMAGLFAGGLSLTALHNHLNQVSPTSCISITWGAASRSHWRRPSTEDSQLAGPPSRERPRARLPRPRRSISQPSRRSWAVGRLQAGDVFQVNVPRAETIREMGTELLPAMGVVTVLNFQPTDDGSAATTGDFVLTESEVNLVASTLLANGIELTALHNHGLADEPRLFYIHFWATGDLVRLAQGLRAALDQTNSQS